MPSWVFWWDPDPWKWPKKNCPQKKRKGKNGGNGKTLPLKKGKEGPRLKEDQSLSTKGNFQVRNGGEKQFLTNRELPG